jgi:cobalt-zinc-cadmium efflux system outer membrane protein
MGNTGYAIAMNSIIFFRARFSPSSQRFFILLSVIFLLPLLALSPKYANAEEIDLKDALKLFYNNNYEILVNKYNVDKAYADFIGSKLYPNPSLLAGNIGHNFVTGTPRVNSNTQTTVRIEQLIELGGRRQLRINSAEESLGVAELFQKDKVRNLLAGFYDVWFNLLLERQQLDFVRNDLKQLDNILKIADARFNAGTLSKIEHAKLRLFRLERITALSHAESKYLNRQEDFSLLIGGEKKYNPVPASDNSEASDALTEEALTRGAMENRYDLLALQKQLKSADLNLAAARSYRIPDVTLGLQYDNFAGAADPYIGGGIALALPIFNRNEGLIGKRAAERSQVEALIEKTRRSVITEVKKSLNNYMSALNIEKSLTGRKNEIEDLLKRSSAAFGLGGINALDLLDAQRTHLEFNNKYLQSRAQTLLSYKLLKIATGEID